MVVAITNNCILSSSPPTSTSPSSSSPSSPTNDHIPLGIRNTIQDDETDSYQTTTNVGEAGEQREQQSSPRPPQQAQQAQTPPSYRNILTVRLTPNENDDVIPYPPPQTTPTTTTSSVAGVVTNDVIQLNGGHGTRGTTGTTAPGTNIVLGPHGLPSYDEAIDPNLNIIAPPSYDSLFGRVRQARKQSNGIADFFKNILILLLGTLSCTIVLGITFVIPVCMLVFGMLYLNECPQGEYIPVYLLIGGFMGILKHLLHLSIRVRQPEEQAAEALRQSGTQTLINWFILGWFFIGSYWVYREYEPNYNPQLGKYCNKTLYLFSFWLITSIYMVVGVLTIILILISIISVLLMNRQNPINNINV